jgi:hypothetical protein
LELIAGAFPIQLLVGSRLTLAGRLHLWGLVFYVRDLPIHIKFAAKMAASRYHVTAGSPALQSSCQRTTPSDYCRDSGFVQVVFLEFTFKGGRFTGSSGQKLPPQPSFLRLARDPTGACHTGLRALAGAKGI